jgi:hypothetical protein
MKMKSFVGVLLFTHVLSAGLAGPPACLAEPPAGKSAVQDFQGFWSDFRTATLANDLGRIMAMTRFPFRTRGPMDDDPVVSHGKDGFAKLWEKLLLQDPGLRPEPETVRQLIQRKVRISAAEHGRGASTARVAGLVFERVNGRWFFTRAYVEE